MLKRTIIHIVILFLIPFFCQATVLDEASVRVSARLELTNGNYKNAYELYEKLCFNPNTNPKQIGQDLAHAVQCLANLNRIDEADAIREKTIALHENNWRLLMAAARSYADLQHSGYIVAGEFKRGHHRGGGKHADATERDRVRALQLMANAMQSASDEPDKNAVAGLYLNFADFLALHRGHNQAWRLQYLTDLSQLPDYEEGRHYYGSGSRGAPTDTDGNPGFYQIPVSWEAAQNDGERWRFLLVQAMELNPGFANTVKHRFANFLYHQFGVHTLRAYGFSPHLGEPDEQSDTASGLFTIHTLKTDETIARLATGIKRFTLPDEFNFIRIFEDTKNYPMLGRIFENRRQYPKAASYFRQAGNKAKVKQITGNWGVFEPVTVKPAGKAVRADYRFRNGRNVKFEAYRIKTRKLLDDLKKYIKSNPWKPDWQKENLNNIGYRLVHENQKRYIGDRAAQWSLKLEPRTGHSDRRITVDIPLREAGAYLLIAQMEDGNISRIIIWIDDTVIVKKPLDNSMLFYVADAVSGAPVENATVEFFGYQRKRRNKLLGYHTDIENFAEYTNRSGLIILTSDGRHPNMDTDAVISDAAFDRNKRWLIIATTPNGRLAFLGFTHVWFSKHYDRDYNKVKVLAITDRPVYRPEHTVKFNCWVRNAKYDQPDKSNFANRSVTVTITDPRAEKVYEKTVTADEYGGVAGEFTLSADATLGVYSITLPNYGSGGHFRVEEYKKPEFEVKVEAPSEPVMLGETVTAKVEAKYYFGAPVTHAKVKYKVLRYAHSQTWYPPALWDWFYNPGYWWFGYDYTWYPGWSQWGCRRPYPWWLPVRHAPPEIVMENEVPISADGSVNIPIDTSLAKELHGDTDHRYEITAEVTDLSRRTIVGSGKVLAARQPFKVFAWTDRGYYHSGDIVQASFKAKTSDDKPVLGKGKAVLHQIGYDHSGQVIEKAVQTWKVDPDPEGLAQIKIKAARPGQYRIAYTVTDIKNHTIEGGYVFVVRGQGFDGADFRFDHIELVTDKKEYAPGENVRMMINTEQPDATVLLFLRPANGVYRAPKMLRLNGKSTLVDFKIAQKDMPNFFVEAITIANGKLHTETREIIVPPGKRIINVNVEPSSKRYRPGEKADVKVRLTDLDGLPFVGSCVISVYDKAVEYISGGSNVPEIRSFFWKWRRRHHPQTESTHARVFHNLLKKNETSMYHLGVFGHLVADTDEFGDTTLGTAISDKRGYRATGVMRINKGAKMMMAAPVAAPAPAKPGSPSIANEAMAQAADMEASDGQPAMAEAAVRTQFADTAFWAAAVTTDEQGYVSFSFNMPENLTGWKFKVWGMGHGTKVGQGVAEAVTAKNLMVRLQAPRFFVQKDEVVLSANVHNYLENDADARVVLELDGPCLDLSGKQQQTVNIKSGEEVRVDWRVKVKFEGEAVVRMKALTTAESDALEMRFPVYVHGMDKQVAFSGTVRPDKQQSWFTIQVPQERRSEASRLEIRYSPTLAGAMVDALPYLAAYPYGCTEQTLNRFLPTVITHNILKRMNLDMAAIQEKRTNLNAQEIGDDRERAGQWKQFERNPVFDTDEVRRMVKKGVNRLTNMQLSDGGWGWFSGWGEHSYPHTTAVVMHGLQIARKNRVAIVPSVMDRGVQWLLQYERNQVEMIKNGHPKDKIDPWKQYVDNLDALIYMVLADAGHQNEAMREFLYEDRNHLTVYGKTIYGLALHQQKHREKLKMLLSNIEQYLVQDDENQTAWLNLGNDSYWWYWYGSEIEAHAYYLKLLAAVDPHGDTASRLVKYILNNRKHATYWNSTRDTAVCIEALADYLAASVEDKPDMSVAIYYDGKRMQTEKITSVNLFTFNNKFVMSGDTVESGEHTVEIRRSGKGPVYYNAYLSYFTLEDHIAKAGLEIKTERAYYRLKRVDKTVKTAGSRGQALDQKVEKYERSPLKNLDTLKSGDLIEVELTIQSKNDYEYIVFEDMKAAGFEPVDVRSGYTRNGMNAYMELRDEKVVFFVRRLPRGKHSIAYRLRAEIPGRFSALPTRAYGMYAPELRANSDEIKLYIED